MVDRRDGLLAGDAWVVWPSAAGAAPPRGSSDDAIDAVNRARAGAVRLAGWRGCRRSACRWRETDGCPLGVSLVGPAGADRALLAAAVAASSTTHDPHPEVPS